MKNKKVIIIISGGMDSITLLHDIVKKHGVENVTAISFLYGSKHMNKEIPMAKENCAILKVEHKLIDMQKVFSNFSSALLNKKDSEEIPEGHYAASNMKKTIVPFRNGILLAVAAGIAETTGAKIIYYGAHAGDHQIYEDCRKEFIETMSEAIRIGTMNGITVKAPYWNGNKISILKKGIKLGVDYAKTWTCYSPLKNGQPCGKCGADLERVEAFLKNKLQDPLYIQKNWEEAVRYYNEIIK